MGLLNVYSFGKTIKPHLAYRFKVTFFYNQGAEEIESLTYFVKSVDLPVWNISTENRQRFGNTQYVIPTFDFGQSVMKIVFLENDYMNLTYFLNGFLFNNVENAQMEANLWNNCAPQIIKVKVDELDPSMRYTAVSNIYACHLKRLSAPHFGSLNYGTPVELEAEFVIRYKLNSLATEVGSEPRQISEPETFRQNIINDRASEEDKVKTIKDAQNKLAAINAARLASKKDNKKKLETKKKNLEVFVAQQEEKQKELQKKINERLGKNKELYTKIQKLEQKLEVINKARRQAGLEPIYGLDVENTMNSLNKDVVSTNVVKDGMYGKKTIEAGAMATNGVESFELTQKLKAYGIGYEESKHGDTSSTLATITGAFTGKQLGATESITIKDDDLEKFEARSANDIASLLSDIDQLNRELKNKTDVSALNKDKAELAAMSKSLSQAKQELSQTNNDLAFATQDLEREMNGVAKSGRGKNLASSGASSGNQGFEAFKNSKRQDGLCARNTLNAVNAYYETGYITGKGSGKDIANSDSLAAELRNNRNVENVEQLGKQKINSVSDINKLQSSLLGNNQTMVVSIKFTDKKAAMEAGISENSAEHGHSMFVTQNDIVSSKNQSTISTYNEKAMSELIKKGLVEVSVMRITNKTS